MTTRHRKACAATTAATKICSALSLAVAMEDSAAWGRALMALVVNVAGGGTWVPCEVREGATNRVATAAARMPEVFSNPIYLLRQGTTVLNWRDCVLVGRPAGEIPEVPIVGLAVTWHADGLGLLDGRATSLTICNDLLIDHSGSYGGRFRTLNCGWGNQNERRAQSPDFGHQAGTADAE